MGVRDVIKKASSSYKSKYFYKYIKPKNVGDKLYSLYFLMLYVFVIVPLFFLVKVKINILIALISVIVISILMCFFIIIVTYIMCLLFEIPKIIIYNGIEEITTLIEKCFKDQFYSQSNIVTSFLEHEKLYNLTSIPNDKYVLDYYTYKLKSQNIKLITTIPIAATLIWKSAKSGFLLINDLLGQYNFNDFYLSLQSFILENNIFFNSNFFNLYVLAYFLIIYLGEIERIQDDILKLELIKQIKQSNYV